MTRKVTAARAFNASLPWPPSVNHYWRRVGSRTLISREGRAYRDRLAVLLYPPPRIAGPLDVEIGAYPPDRRKRDLDNVLKALLDAMQHAGVYADDSQIARLEIVRCEVRPGGLVVVRVRPTGREEGSR